VSQKLQMLITGDDLFYENILKAQKAVDAGGTMQMIRHLSMDMKIAGRCCSFTTAHKPPDYSVSDSTRSTLASSNRRLPPLDLGPRSPDPSRHGSLVPPNVDDDGEQASPSCSPSHALYRHAVKMSASMSSSSMSGANVDDLLAAGDTCEATGQPVATDPTTIGQFAAVVKQCLVRHLPSTVDAQVLTYQVRV